MSNIFVIFGGRGVIVNHVIVYVIKDVQDITKPGKVGNFFQDILLLLNFFVNDEKIIYEQCNKRKHIYFFHEGKNVM